MNDLEQLFSNSILWISILAWFIAQTLKVVLTLITKKKFDIRRFVGAGGMPSSHSAFVVSLATSVGKVHGFDSSMFAMAVTFAIIVMYDAAGVRRAAGRQAAVLNDIVEQLQARKGFPDEKLKELIGHTPVEVIVGGLLGIFISKLFF